MNSYLGLFAGVHFVTLATLTLLPNNTYIALHKSGNLTSSLLVMNMSLRDFIPKGDAKQILKLNNLMYLQETVWAKV